MARTRTEIERAQKKVEIAINKMIDLQDMGFGCSAVEEILDRLRGLTRHIDATA